jgi:hypothetical protein
MSPAQIVPVFRADDFRAVDGANLGDPLSFAAELILDDAYALPGEPEPQTLAICPSGTDGALEIAAGGTLGTPGARLHLDSCLTLMPANGNTVEALVLVELSGAEATAADAVYVMPLASIAPREEYRLVGIDRASARRKLAQYACVAFTRGTAITLASGAQRPIEELRPGDRVLTRDAGPREVRWIGQTTLRASGAFAPIRIRAGALNNSGDLVVSPGHRLFIYQREDALGLGRAEVLVQARHLVNGTTVTRMDGGFVDYFQLLFDDHHIVYAEGIAAESLLLDTATEAALPADLARDLIGRATRQGAGLGSVEVDEGQIRAADAADAAETLRRASLH